MDLRTVTEKVWTVTYKEGVRTDTGQRMRGWFVQRLHHPPFFGLICVKWQIMVLTGGWTLSIGFPLEWPRLRREFKGAKWRVACGPVSVRREDSS